MGNDADKGITMDRFSTVTANEREDEAKLLFYLFKLAIFQI